MRASRAENANRLRFLQSALILALILGTSASARAQSPPDAPVILSPSPNGEIVSPFDVHMETSPMTDPDPGDTHACTDWEIWTVSPSERVWAALCIGGIERIHAHLADGQFEGSYAGRTALQYQTTYRMQVRHRDNTGLWSAWSERAFTTGAQSQIFPLLVDDVLGAPAPLWVDDHRIRVILYGGSPPALVRLESGSGGLLLEIAGLNGTSNAINNPAAPIPHDDPVRLVVQGGSTGLTLSPSNLTFYDGTGGAHTVYLPALGIPPGGRADYWVSADGGTYVGASQQTAPDFQTVARGSAVPWRVFQPGYQVEVVATGFQLPVNIAFVPNPGPLQSDPAYYVTELYGSIKVVSRDGTVSDYATGLLNFNPTGNFPGSGEQGVAGTVAEPISGDLFVSLLYDSAPPNGAHFPKVIRLHSDDGGRTAATQTTVLDMPGEEQGASHFISNLTIGPDGKLYVHMGDGFASATALNLDSFRGKVLRVNQDGSAPTDNPFYDTADGIHARDYVFAYGFRNPFGGAWRTSDASHYEVENGNAENDRFAKVTRGTSYGWNGSDATMTTNAIYNWVSVVAPVNIDFIQTSKFGGSGFPAGKQDHAFVTESGATYAPGPNSAKRVVEFAVNGSGGYVSGPDAFVQYNGSGMATAAGLAAGPDGLYFTDLYKDLDFTSPIDRGANVLRIKYVGIADFTSDVQTGPGPLTVHFVDLSDVPGALTWLWDFGDGTTSTEQNPTHLYNADGSYTVRLGVTGPSGTVVANKSGYIAVGSSLQGLQAAYYDDLDFTGAVLRRIDPNVDFDWQLGSPDPTMGVDTYSVVWTGTVTPLYTETYTFYTVSDDGARLWVNDQLVVDSWVDQAVSERSGTITLTAGQAYSLKMEYFENGGLAVARLLWSSASQAKQVIPTQLLSPGGPAPTIKLEASRRITRATLGAPRPSPFVAGTDLEFAVPEAGRVTLRIYDAQGRAVATLFDGEVEGQTVRHVRLEASRLAAGIYFERMEYRGLRLAQKLILLR